MNGETMQTEAKTYDVRVDIEEYANGFYVGEQARAAMQADALDQLGDHMDRARALTTSLDPTSLDECKAAEWELGRAGDAIRALVALAPPSDEDDPSA